jgi:hypothetical protein
MERSLSLMIRIVSQSTNGGFALFLAALSCCALDSVAQENNVPEMTEPTAWLEGVLGDGSRPELERLNADGKISVEEVLDLTYKWKSRHDGDSQCLAAFILTHWQEDPVPALRAMMVEKNPERRAFGAITAAGLGDIRLEPDLERLADDKTVIGEFAGDWFAGDTISEVAETSLDYLLKRGLHGRSDEVHGDERPNLPVPSWLKLKPVASQEITSVLEKVRKRHDEALEVAAADYRRGLAEAISAAMEIEIFLLDFETEEVDAKAFHRDTKPPRDRFPIVPYGSTSKILQRKRLSQDEVKALMPSLKDTVGVEKNTYGAMCHFPVHGIRIRNGDHVIFQTSICYECMNFYVEYNDGGQDASWTGLSSKEFQEVMLRLMPIPASEIERFEKKKAEARGK